MRMVLGIDEAGRGPLAGPIAVGTVRASEGYDFHAVFPGLNDSKKLTEALREELFSILDERTKAGELAFHVELVSHRVIDERGIVFATRRGVRKGVTRLLPDPAGGKVWLDGLLRAPHKYEQETVIGGDALVPAIMLASIAAKVTRDRYMTRLGKRYPHYGFAKHKGYGTDFHYQMLREHGPCAYHRTTFIHLEELDPVLKEG